MSEEEINQSEKRWAIDLNWMKLNNRSFSALAGDSLCPKCQKKLKVDSGEAKAVDLLKATQRCCSKEQGFITSNLPVQESIFRIFLANGNEPLTLEELSERLSQRRGIESYRASSTVLSRLMANDQHYGLRQLTA